VSVAWLSEGSDSSTPLGTAIDAAFASVPVAPGATVPVSVNVAVPPGGRPTAAAMPPLPDGGQVAPDDAAQVQLTPVSAAGGASVTGAADTGDGPAFAVTIV
jgi:hypothetical protein